MDDADAVDALTTLGLSTYAAQTFVGLQKLGIASASEVAQVTDVPRSQVYGATDELEELGLVDVQDASPKRYRPVAVEEARELLFERLESTGDAAFDYLESVHGQRAATDEGREAIWTTEGTGNITSRVTSLVNEADERVLFATGEPTLIEGAVLDALAGRADEGLQVVVASSDAAVRSAASEAGLSVLAVENDTATDIRVGRVLVADDDTLLLSVLPSDGMANIAVESAFWSAGTGFATILARLVRDQFG